MIRYARLLLMLICITLLAPQQPQTMPSAHAATHHLTPADASDLVPLPDSCGGGLPTSENPASVCCMFGYVVIDGQAVAGAKVTITDTATGKSAEAWTDYGPNSSQPYYRISLSERLSAQIGDTITVKAEYSAHSQTVTHNALAGGQQVDIVLPRNQTNDYTYERQLGQPSARGTFQRPASVAVDTTGTSFVVDSVNSRVLVFNQDKQFLYAWGQAGSGIGEFANPLGIALDGDSNVYVADTNNHRVQVFSRTGEFLRSWGSLGNAETYFYEPSGITVDNSGNVYVADTLNNRIQVFFTTGVFIRSVGSAGTGNGQFIRPVSVAVDGSGRLYVADSNHRIQVFSSTGAYLNQWGGNGTEPGQFNTPHGITVSKTGQVYVADTYNNRVQVFTSDGVFIKAWGTPSAGNDQLANPLGITISDDNIVYVADTLNQRVQTFSASGSFIGTIGTAGSGAGVLIEPWGVDVDRDGTVYVSDKATHRVEVFSSTGTFVRQWGQHGDAEGQLDYPQGIAVGSDGRVYVANSGNARIDIFDGLGTPKGGWGSFGNGDNQFNNPGDVALDAASKWVYVADTDSHRVQKFNTAGVHVMTLGSVISGTLDTQFINPHSVAVDNSGDIYVLDSGNSRIQVFHSNGTFVRTISGFGYNLGQLIYPNGIAVSGDGTIYVADSSNNRVQIFGKDDTARMVLGDAGGGDGLFSFPEAIAVGGDGRLYVADTNNHRIQILHPMSYTRPIATIVQATPRSVVPGQTVELHGRGGVSMPSSTITSYEWTLDGNATPFATNPNATLPSLAPGTHTVSFRVRDNNGSFSDAQSVEIIASGPPNPNETWTFMLYLDGDNNLAPFLNLDSQLGALYRLKHGLPNANVRIVALYDGSRSGDSFRYTFGTSAGFTQEALGEVNMGDPQTIISFVNWGKQQAPADHYYLAIADHANALDGIAWDGTTAPIDHITNSELRQALVAITDNGAHPLDVLHLDGCLMGLLENAYQVRGLTMYLITSENLAWSAFAYDAYRQTVGAHTNARALALAIVDSYAAQVGGQAKPYTLAALDLGKVDDVAIKTNALAQELLRYALDKQKGTANREMLVSWRTQAQKLDSGGDIAITNDDEYVDLAHWLALLAKGVGDNAITTRATAVLNALPALIIREHHESGKVGTLAVNLQQANGLAIYYPPRASAKTYQTYAQGELSFTTDTLWDEFLAAGLAALPFDPSAPEPHPVAPLGQQIFIPISNR